jgi:hypothetical protein
MSGTATLTRTPTVTPPSRSTVLARPPRLTSLRWALVVATFAMACLAVSYARELVVDFARSTATVGGFVLYAHGTAATLGWLLAAGALSFGYVAATEFGAPRAGRVGLIVSVLGAILLAGAGACAIWATVVQDDAPRSGGSLAFTQATSITNEVLELFKAGLAFQAAGFLVLAVAAFVAWSAPRGGSAGRGSAAWHGMLLAVGVGFLVAAVAPAYTWAHVVWWASSPPNQLYVLMTTVPPVVAWLAIALGLFCAGSALRRSPRTTNLAIAGAIGGIGACVLAVAYGTELLYAQLQLSDTHLGWFSNLAKTSSLTTWAGWLLLAAAFGVAAVRLMERDVLVRPAATIALA